MLDWWFEPLLGTTSSSSKLSPLPEVWLIRGRSGSIHLCSIHTGFGGFYRRVVLLEIFVSFPTSQLGCGTCAGFEICSWLPYFPFLSPFSTLGLFPITPRPSDVFLSLQGGCCGAELPLPVQPSVLWIIVAALLSRTIPLRKPSLGKAALTEMTTLSTSHFN